MVPDGRVDFDATRNLPEIEALVKRLYDIVVEDERKILIILFLSE